MSQGPSGVTEIITKLRTTFSKHNRYTYTCVCMCVCTCITFFETIFFLIYFPFNHFYSFFSPFNPSTLWSATLPLSTLFPDFLLNFPLSLYFTTAFLFIPFPALHRFPHLRTLTFSSFQSFTQRDKPHGHFI